MKIGTVISNLVERGYKKVKTLIEGKADTRKPFEAAPFGYDGKPPAGYKAIIADTGEDGKTVVIGYINTKQLESLNNGEVRLYSLDSDGNVSAHQTFTNDGKIQMLGTGDFLVNFSGLQAAFNQLQADHDALAAAWDAFAAAYTPGGPSTQGLPPSASTVGSSSADIDPAKIEEIETA